MVARKKVVLLTELREDAQLRSSVESLDVQPNQCAAMLKDCHLIEAANETDRTVVSRDDEARALFAAHNASIQSLAEIVWVNPIESPDELDAWLGNGAQPEEPYLLANHRIVQ